MSAHGGIFCVAALKTFEVNFWSTCDGSLVREGEREKEKERGEKRKKERERKKN